MSAEMRWWMVPAPPWPAIFECVGVEVPVNVNIDDYWVFGGENGLVLVDKAWRLKSWEIVDWSARSMNDDCTRTYRLTFRFTRVGRRQELTTVGEITVPAWEMGERVVYVVENEERVRDLMSVGLMMSGS